MKIKGRHFSVKKLICLFVYYTFAQYLPDSYCFIRPIGKISNWIRVWLCKRIFKKCGRIRTINRRVDFGSGRDVIMGDESGIGCNTHIPNDTYIGNNVILGRHCYFLERNHIYDRTDIPINYQGKAATKQTIIEDDCWIGMYSLFTPGRHISKGTVIGMGSVVTHDYPEYSIIGGAPAKFIRSRKE